MKNDNCIFCKIANGEIQSSALYEDKNFKVIQDIAPASKGHMLILPKNHYADIEEVPDELRAEILNLAAMLGKKSKKILGASGFNILLNTGKSAGQTVFHCHTHVIPRYDNGEIMLNWKEHGTTKEELKEIADKFISAAE